jgi:hypothetical protein
MIKPQKANIWRCEEYCEQMLCLHLFEKWKAPFRAKRERKNWKNCIRNYVYIILFY